MSLSRKGARTRWVVGFAISLLLVSGLPARAVDSIRLVLPATPSKLVVNSARLFARQVSQRCGAKVVYSGEAGLTVHLEVSRGKGREGYTVADNPGGGVRIVGTMTAAYSTGWVSFCEPQLMALMVSHQVTGEGHPFRKKKFVESTSRPTFTTFITKLPFKIFKPTWKI